MYLHGLKKLKNIKKDMVCHTWSFSEMFIFHSYFLKNQFSYIIQWNKSYKAEVKVFRKHGTQLKGNGKKSWDYSEGISDVGMENLKALWRMSSRVKWIPRARVWKTLICFGNFKTPRRANHRVVMPPRSKWKYTQIVGIGQNPEERICSAFYFWHITLREWLA